MLPGGCGASEGPWAAPRTTPPQRRAQKSSARYAGRAAEKGVKILVALILPQYCQYALDTHDARVERRPPVERRPRVARKVGRSFVFCVGSLTYLSALLLYLVTFNAVGNEFAVRCD